MYYRGVGIIKFGIVTIRDFDNSGFRHFRILTFRDLECRDFVPSGFRVSGFWTDPLLVSSFGFYRINFIS